MLAETELEVALVVGRQLDSNFDARVRLVRADNRRLTVAAAVLVGARLEPTSHEQRLEQQ